ncbi:MAG: YidH family protein [Rhodanobacteraceae bacterium]
MIPRFSDHAANERTYLAWVRTAIAIMAFGFVIERFDLFLAYLSDSAKTLIHRSHAAQFVGLALIVLSVVMMFTATVRYIHHRKSISAAEPGGYGSSLGDALLALLLICLGVFLIAYVAHQVVMQGR